MIRSKTLMFNTWNLFTYWYSYMKLSFDTLKLRLVRLAPGYSSKVLVVITY
jgi:hypothetical protein